MQNSHLFAYAKGVSHKAAEYEYHLGGSEINDSNDGHDDAVQTDDGISLNMLLLMLHRHQRSYHKLPYDCGSWQKMPF